MNIKYNSKLAIGSAIISFACINGNAEATDLKLSDENTVVVSGDRFEQSLLQVPTQIKVIDQDFIQKSGATNLRQLLRRVASLQVSELSGKTLVSMRGISGEQAANNVLIQVDGRRLNNTDIAAPDLETINVENIARIEIIQGSATSLYGDQAVAGVINIISKDPSDASSSISLTAGTYDHLGAAVNLNHAINKEWYLSFLANSRKTDNFRKHNEQETNQFAAKLNYQTQTSDWLFEISSHDEELDIPGALLESDLGDLRQSRPEFINDFVDTKRKLLRVFGQESFGKDWQFAIDVNHSESDIESINSFINFATNTVNFTDRKQLSVYPRFKKQWLTDSGNSELVFGLDYDKNDYEFSLLSRANEQEVKSIYAQSYIALSKNTQLQIAGRYADAKDELIDLFAYANGVSLDNSASAFDLGLNHQYSTSLNLFARYSRSYRFAKVDEQAYTSPGVLGLNPQKGNSLELGLNWKSNGHSLDLSVYELDLKDEIFFDPTAPQPAGAFFAGANVNGAESERFGVNLDYTLNASDNLDIGFGYHYVDAKPKQQGVNLQVPGVSKNTANVWLDYQFDQSWNFYLEGNYRGKRLQDGDVGNFSDPIKSHTLVNAAINWQIKQWTLGLRIDNLFDKDYIEYAQFNGFYPGHDRTTNLRVVYRF